MDPQVYAGALRCVQGPSGVYGGPLGCVQGPSGVQQLFPASQSERPALSSENEAGGGELVFRTALENKVCVGAGRTLTIRDTRGPSILGRPGDPVPSEGAGGFCCFCYCISGVRRRAFSRPGKHFPHASF